MLPPCFPEGRVVCVRCRLQHVSPLRLLEKFGAGEGARTLDPDLGKVVLYH
jgi:hypothetical protein